MKDGVIADFEVTERLLRDFINKATAVPGLDGPRGHFRTFRCDGGGKAGGDRRGTVRRGERRAVIEEPMAAAIGAGLPVQDPTGTMIVDIGGGTTEVAVISLGGIVAHRSIRVAGDEMDEAIVQHIRRNYNLLIGERTAERIKMEIGHATINARDEETMEVRGRDLVTGLPKTVVVSSTEIHEALEEPVQAIVDAVKVTLEQTPPELAADIMDRGIMLAGRSAPQGP